MPKRRTVMVSKSKENTGKKKKIKVLNLNKETVKDLTEKDSKGVMGGTTACIGSRVSVRGTDDPNISPTSEIRQTSGMANSTGGFNR
jgi:hypothetical protein